MGNRKLLLILLLFAIASTTQTVAAPPIQKVILVSIDTLRADYLGCYDPKAKTTPQLDRFAAANVICKNVTSQSATTAPSHKSIFYSLYPSIHKTSIRSVPQESIRSPVEVIRANGYRTAAFTGGGQISHAFGFARGFDTYREPDTDPFVTNPIKEMEKAAFDWLDQHSKERFFLFLHTYEVHCPYNPPKNLFQKWAAWYDGPLRKETCFPDFHLPGKPSPADYKFIRNLYAAEVNYVDRFMGILFNKLKALGIYDETLIVFLSDHGESLGEHGYIGHSQLMQVQLHVPLILHIPGVGATQIDAPLESIDVMPTIFELLKIQRTGVEFQGKSIVPLIQNPKTFDKNRALISEERDQVRVRVGDMALVFSPNGRFTEQLYNLALDPSEMVNIAAKNPQISQRLKRPYYKMIGESKNVASHFLETGKKPVLDEETKDQLRALGYVSQ